MSNHNYLFYPGLGFAQITQHIADRVFPERVRFPHCTESGLISYTFSHFVQNCCRHTRLGTCTHTLSTSVVICVMSKSYNAYSTCSLEAGSYRKQMTYFFVLITIDTESFVTLALLMCDQCGACTALANFACALISTTRSVIIKAGLTPKISVETGAGYSKPCGYTRRVGHTVATCVIASVYVYFYTYLHHLLYPRTRAA